MLWLWWQRALLYEITGDGLASTLFRLDVNNGLITLAQSLRSDTADSYVVSHVTLGGGGGGGGCTQ